LSAALVAEYSGASTAGIRPFSDETLTIAPRLGTRCGSAARIARTAPRELVSNAHSPLVGRRREAVEVQSRSADVVDEEVKAAVSVDKEMSQDSAPGRAGGRTR
jgi:hypothetical protein